MATQDGEDDDLYYSIEIDWCRCPLLESVPGKLSGAWVIKGTRMPAQAIIDNHDAGLDPHDRSQQRRLSSAAGSEQAGDHAGADLEGEAVQDLPSPAHHT